MEEHERQLALRYAPHVYFDKNETIPLALVGYDIHRGTRRSRSFRRTLAVDLEKAEFVIEYAYYFDYDIQHMYDLEHVWVWVGHDGQVVDAECSSHGQYVNCWRYRPQAEDGTHVAVYCQPGKHAFFPDGKLFLLFSNVYETCTKLAGIDGLLIAPFFQGRITKDSYTDYVVCQHIRKTYSFQPSLEFVYQPTPEDIFLPVETLLPRIEGRLNAMLGQLHLQ